MSKSSPSLNVVTVMIDPDNGSLLVDIGALSELAAWVLLAAAAQAIGHTSVVARVQSGSRTVWQGRIQVNEPEEWGQTDDTDE